MSQNAVQAFTEALENWQEANRAYHKAIASCDSSPAYWCYREEEAMDRATKQMQKAFVDAVREAVAEIAKEAK